METSSVSSLFLPVQSHPIPSDGCSFILSAMTVEDPQCCSSISNCDIALNLKKHFNLQILTQFSARYVSRFVRAVKFLQRVVRDSIACRNARILALSKVWDAYETQYISVSTESVFSISLTYFLLSVYHCRIFQHRVDYRIETSVCTQIDTV